MKTNDFDVMKTFRFTFSSCFSTSYPSLVNWKWNFNRNANWKNLKCSSRLIRQWTTSTSIDRRLFIFQRKKKDETSPKLLNGRMCKVFLSLSSKITIKVFYAVLSNLSTCMYIFFYSISRKWSRLFMTNENPLFGCIIHQLCR